MTSNMKAISFVTIKKSNFSSYRKVFIIILILFFILLSGCSSDIKADEPITRTGFAMNTVIQIDLYGTTDSSILDECFSLCSYYESIFSRTMTTSELYALNENSDKQNEISSDLYQLISTGLAYGSISDGRFDITIAPLSDLWNFSSESPTVPDKNDILALLPLVDYRTISLSGTNILNKENPDTKIDLGAVAKGYIADCLKAYLLSEDVTSAVINLGGNVLCVGSKPDGSDFRIGIQKPFGAQDEIAAAFHLSDMSVVTSGIYERYFEEDGVLYHHILDAATGYPCNNDLLSVTILSKKSVDGDALSTTCFLLGLEDGMKLIDSMDDTYAMFITNDGQTHFTTGATNYLIN